MPTTKTPPPAIIIEGVSKTFPAKPRAIHAVDDVTLSISQGEIFGLLGPNGAGKTTLINILCGLLYKDEGTIEILGLDLDTELHAIKQQINLVQGFSGIGLKLTVYEFLTYACMLYNLPNRNERIRHAIKRLGLHGKEEHIALDLSSGYKQRLLLARALLNAPKILVLDEPTVGLDVEIAIRVRELIKELQKEGTTILLTTHNMYEVEELCDRIALINHGAILAMGSVEQIKKHIPLGAAVEITADHPELIIGALRSLSYAKGVHMEEGTIHLELSSRDRMQHLLRDLARLDIPLTGVKLIEPTLEQAFIRITRQEPRKNSTSGKRHARGRESHVA